VCSLHLERILEYSYIPREGARIIPTNRPASSWPSQGEVVIDALKMKYRPELEYVLKVSYLIFLETISETLSSCLLAELFLVNSYCTEIMCTPGHLGFNSTSGEGWSVWPNRGGQVQSVWCLLSAHGAQRRYNHHRRGTFSVDHF